MPLIYLQSRRQEGFPDYNLFLFLPKNVSCGYSLEASHGDASNERHNNCFCAEVIKISPFFCSVLNGSLDSLSSVLGIQFVVCPLMFLLILIS